MNVPAIAYEGAYKEVKFQNEFLTSVLLETEAAYDALRARYDALRAEVEALKAEVARLTPPF